MLCNTVKETLVVPVRIPFGQFPNQAVVFAHPSRVHGSQTYLKIHHVSKQLFGCGRYNVQWRMRDKTEKRTKHLSSIPLTTRTEVVPGCSLVRLSPPLKQCIFGECVRHSSLNGFSKTGSRALRNIISRHFIIPARFNSMLQPKHKVNDMSNSLSS